MQSIREAQIQHTKTITGFQVTMAMETQNLKLNQELVEKGLENFLSVFSGVESSHLGLYLLKFVDDKPVGCLLITYESATKWWFNSIYVLPQHRGYGHFTSLFKWGVELARQKGVQSIKLYTNRYNEQAKAIYFKQGMRPIEGLFYCYDYVLRKPSISVNNHFQFVEDPTTNQTFSKWKSLNQNILGIQIKQNQGNFVTIEKEKTVIGVFKFFEEFSDWRYGIIRYVPELYITGYSLMDVVPAIVDYLIKSSKIKVSTVRFITKELITAQMSGGEVEQDEVLALDLK